MSTFLIIQINFKYIHIITSLGFRAPSLMIKKERIIQIRFLNSWNYEILCHLDVECDYHYIFKCSLYNEYRKLCIKLSSLLQILTTFLLWSWLIKQKWFVFRYCTWRISRDLTTYSTSADQSYGTVPSSRLL